MLAIVFCHDSNTVQEIWIIYLHIITKPSPHIKLLHFQFSNNF